LKLRNATQSLNIYINLVLQYIDTSNQFVLSGFTWEVDAAPTQCDLWWDS
jgi:hypothetical protein